MHLVLHRLSVPVCVFTQDFKTSSPVLSGMLRDHAMAPYFEENDHSSKSAISILGSMFLNFFFGYFPEGTDNATVGQFFIRRFIAVHVDDFLSKHDVLVLMARKLCCFARNECCEDNIDSLGYQELLLPGHLLSAFVTEKLGESLTQAASHVQREARIDFDDIASKLRYEPLAYCGKTIGRYSGIICDKVSSLLASGNLVSSSGLDLQQTTGFAIVAERLNKWRYFSHFRSVHRGQFFTTMKTTAVRKLLPEAWGFLCPVHTPDGGPCGLLSHLTARAHIICSRSNTIHAHSRLLDIIVSLGMAPNHTSSCGIDCTFLVLSRQRICDSTLNICLDGVLLGSAPCLVCAKISDALRRLKANSAFRLGLDPTLEIAFIDQGPTNSSPFPGLYLFSQAARCVRPVIQCGTESKIELIGPFEQMTLQIACNFRGLKSGVGDTSLSGASAETHAEIDPSNMLSFLASLTPFSDFNQSPRNMYQCQMGKQTMGTPAHAMIHRCDSKMYRILTPQAPLVCTHDYTTSNFNLYAQGTNSVVAVISYTGYDMEDAMIINKSAYQRGFGHGVVYKNIIVDLDLEADRRRDQSQSEPADFLLFGSPPPISTQKSDQNAGDPHRDSSYHVDSSPATSYIGEDGLPEIGQKICHGDSLWCAFYELSCKKVIGVHKDAETAYVDAVRFIG